VCLILEQIQDAGFHIADLEHDPLAAFVVFITVKASHCKYLLFFFLFFICPGTAAQ
jgi:hypothetical protein